MKYIYTIIIVLALSFTAQAQVIIPLDEYSEYFETLVGDVPHHKYFKDVNGMLNPYIGVWEGTYENKTYYFEITKLTKKPLGVEPEFAQTFTDELLVDFKITDNANNKVLYDKFTVNQEFKIDFILLPESDTTRIVMLYYGDRKEDVDCGDSGRIYLESYANGFNIKVFVSPRGFMFYPRIEGQASINPPCPDGRILPPFPDNENDALILTKVPSQPGLGN